jgi:hypothetical protein
MRISAFFLALLSLACVCLPARAESGGPIGIAFAQADEGTWWCRGGDAGKTLACALDKCRKGAPGQECLASRWCGLAGWSGLMVIWLPEFHSTVPLCGAASQAAVVAALKALCANDEVVTRCDLVSLIDPDGNEKAVEDISWPGPTVTATPEE